MLSKQTNKQNKQGAGFLERSAGPFNTQAVVHKKRI